MSKRAEQRALEAAQQYYDDNSICCSESLTKEIFAAGYELAEEDLALTAEDVGCIFNLVRQMQVKYNATSACYQEVADIFNKDRKEEEK